MEEVIIPTLAIVTLFIALPWIIFHYITRWKTAATLTTEDENLLDELHELARRLDDRMCTIERIVQAENPNWRQIACDPAGVGIEDRPLPEFGGLAREPESAGRPAPTRRRNS